MTDIRFFDDLRIFNISVISGVRPLGRTIDHSTGGRTNSGFVYVFSGETVFYENGKGELRVCDGEIAYLPKGKKYRMRYTAPETTFVVVNFNLCDEHDEEVILFSDITLIGKDDKTNRISKIMMAFELYGVSKTVDALLRKKELMYRLLGMIYTMRSGAFAEGDDNSLIREGVKLLELTYLENLPTTRYAEASHVSLSTFRTLFQKQFGTSPLKYRNSLRIERARELLLEGGFTVAEVAYASGFENLGYFCRSYQRLTGETPSATKKKSNVVHEKK